MAFLHADDLGVRERGGDDFWPPDFVSAPAQPRVRYPDGVEGRHGALEPLEPKVIPVRSAKGTKSMINIKIDRHKQMRHKPL